MLSSPEKKKKTMTTTKKPSLKRKKTKPSPVLSPTPQSNPNPSLPDDLIVSCLARVSSLYYPTLSLVSKNFRSLLSSPELYQTRSSLGRTESRLYLCLQSHPDPTPRWFTLCLKPDRTLTNDIKKKKKSSGYVLATIPIPQSSPTHYSGLVSVGSNIYNIGGPIENAPSSSVSILDCKSHTWRQAPSMKLERSYPATNVLDGKIYVVGGSKECDSSNWMEVFDPKTQTWELVSSPGMEICGYSVSTSAGIDGKLYMFGSINGLTYKPNECRWETVGGEMVYGLFLWFSYCVIENVLYYHSCGEFKWYDTKARLWRNLKGVKGLPKFTFFRYVRLADFGGKMVVLWDSITHSSGYKDKMICCAMIALERRNSEEIWGKVEWHGAILTVPKSYRLEYALSATV